MQWVSGVGEPVRLSVGQRRLLAALAIGAGGVVRADALGDVAGLSASALRTSLSRLRRRIGDEAIVTDGAGYRLGGELDASHFRRLVERDAPFPARLSELDAALSLWSGNAYEEFAHEPWAEIEAMQLDELRLVATEERAALQVSHRVRVGEAVATLRAHVAANPLRDSGRGLLLQALAADGRQADALRAFQDYRSYLLEATGTEPSAAVRAVEQRISGQWHHQNNVGERASAHEPDDHPSHPGPFTPFTPTSPPASSLPRTNGELVGRTTEHRQLGAMLRPSTVLTLVGPGGVGKTRLAVELCRASASGHRDGVSWCDLSAIDDPAALPAAVASTLSISLSAPGTITDAIVEALRSRESLLLFDNCEHLLDAAGALVASIAEGCPAVAVVATSRAPLGIIAEQVWSVAPLDPAGAGLDLFIQRAAAADLAFSPGSDRDSIVALCTRLDGLPLAIELAAARVRTMTPAEMLQRLDENPGLVSRRSGPTRHRTLADTVEWSYQLLSDHERRLLGRLSVFAGGFDQRAVEAVCAAPGTMSEPTTLEALGGLVEQSLVTPERSGRTTRYRLLETIRSYARLKLSPQDALELSDRHQFYYCSLVTEGFEQWRDDYNCGAAVFDDEWDNIRLAVRRALHHADVGSLDRLLEGLAWPALWSVRLEIDGWARQASGLEGRSGATVGLAAHTSALRGRTDEAAALAQAALIEAVGPHDPGTHHAWAALFLVHTARRDTQAALAAAHAAHSSMVAAYGDFADGFWSAILAFLEAKEDPTTAAGFAQRAERLIGSTRNPALSAEVLSMLARYHGRIGDPTRGAACAREALALADEHGLAYCRNSARAALGFLTSMQGAAGAPADIAEALAGAHRDRLWFWVWQSIGTAARWLAHAGDLDAAAVLVGHLDAHDHGNVGASLRGLIDSRPDGYAARSRGARLHRDSIVASALERLAATPPGSRTVSRSGR
ncbi:MAG: AfsR/SARP family transcriptional regulator [Acidimicrobiales bacterium]